MVVAFDYYQWVKVYIPLEDLYNLGHPKKGNANTNDTKPQIPTIKIFSVLGKGELAFFKQKQFLPKNSELIVN